MDLSSGVWDRANERGVSTMSRNLYALAITGFTTAGIIFATLMAGVSLHWTWPFANGAATWGFIIGLTLVALLGTAIFNKSDRPMVSLFGYALVAGSFGLMLGPVVNQYTSASVVRVFAITSLMVIVLGLVGAIIPESLESWGIWLFGALLILLIGYFAIPLFGAFGVDVGGALKIWDWVGILVFAGVTIFDLNRAMHMPRTLDNAIDSSAAVFLDFINLFIRWLSLAGDSKD